MNAVPSNFCSVDYKQDYRISNNYVMLIDDGPCTLALIVLFFHTAPLSAFSATCRYRKKGLTYMDGCSFPGLELAL